MPKFVFQLLFTFAFVVMLTVLFTGTDGFLPSDNFKFCYSVRVVGIGCVFFMFSLKSASGSSSFYIGTCMSSTGKATNFMFIVSKESLLLDVNSS